MRLEGGEGVDDVRGEGMLSVSRGDLFRLPLVLSIVKILELQPPSRRGFHEANVHYYLKGRRLVLEDISLEGTGLSFRGNGTMELDGKVDLMLDTAVFGQRDGLLRSVSKQLARVHVKGLWSKPNVRVDPVPPVIGPLKKLIEVLD